MTTLPLCEEERLSVIKNVVNGKAISEFLKFLREAEGDNLLQVVLYGSVARGDDRADSDIDIFILLKNHDKTETEKVITEDKILGIASRVEDLNSHQVYICPLIRSEKEFMENKTRSLIYYNIADEGILLYAQDTKGA